MHESSTKPIYLSSKMKFKSATDLLVHGRLLIAASPWIPPSQRLCRLILYFYLRSRRASHYQCRWCQALIDYCYAREVRPLPFNSLDRIQKMPSHPNLIPPTICIYIIGRRRKIEDTANLYL